MNSFEVALRSLEMILEEIDSAPEGHPRAAVVHQILATGRMSHALGLLRDAVASSPLPREAEQKIARVIEETRAAEQLTAGMKI